MMQRAHNSHRDVESPFWPGEVTAGHAGGWRCNSAHLAFFASCGIMVNNGSTRLIAG